MFPDAIPFFAVYAGCVRRTLLLAAAALLTIVSCSSDEKSSDNSSDNSSGSGDLVITGPAVVDLTTIAPSATAEPETTISEDSVDDSVPATDSTAGAETDTTDTTDSTPPTDETSATTDPAPVATFAPYESEIYGDAANWICRGDTDDICDETYPLTLVAGDGELTTVPYEVAEAPAADCFYVYPTVSGDPSMNSDLIPDNEIFTTQQQAARFNQQCTVYAPVYRSVTSGGLTGALSGDQAGDFATSWRMAYEDVRDAWRYYLANLNEGRPVVILAHSQGSFHVVTLLREEIDPSPQQRDLILSAIIAGTSFQVAKGLDVGGDTQNMPLCRTSGQTGCVITFQTYRDEVPPTPGALFGRPSPDTDSACVNPAALDGGPAVLKGAYPAGDWVFADTSEAPEISTTHTDVPGLVTGECKTTAEGYNFLAITIDADPTDERADNIPGDGAPNWGLHTVDMTIAQENLMDVVAAQIASFSADG